MSLQNDIVAKAKNSENGYYLLPRKYNDRPNAYWDACSALVDSGHARWLPSSSDYSPGIAITGKPLEL